MEQYFFKKEPDNSEKNKSDEILTKALKLKRAMELGDNKELAGKKYYEYLVDNNLSPSDINDFEKKDIRTAPGDKKKIIINGIEFESTQEFKKYYDGLNFWSQLKIAYDLMKNKVEKSKTT